MSSTKIETFIGWDIIDTNGVPVAWFLERCDADNWMDNYLGKDRMIYEIRSTERKIEMKMSPYSTEQEKRKENETLPTDS